MKQETFTLELITPCFCAGADQSRAEIRAPSIRGELRWWFRVLGGDQEQEREVFGSVHGKAAASAVMLRVRELKRISRKQDLPRWSGNAANDPVGYLSYFASVSSDKKRWREGAFFSPGTTFELHCIWRKPVSEQLKALFDEALWAWFRLGSLGLRGRRGFGALHEQKDNLSSHQYLDRVNQLPNITVKALGPPVAESESKQAWLGALKVLGAELKRLRKDNGLKGKDNTVLGCSDPRIASALHLRPVHVCEGVVPMAFYSEMALPESTQRGRTEISKWLKKSRQ